MNLETYYDGFAWLTYDRDSYDPTPDSHPRSRILGVGKTKELSIASWREQREEYDLENEPEESR